MRPGYYSFVAYTRHPVSLPNTRVFLGAGNNTFTVTTDDVEGLRAALEAEGVEVLAVNRLDCLEAVPLDSLPGEGPEVLDFLTDTKKLCEG